MNEDAKSLSIHTALASTKRQSILATLNEAAPAPLNARNIADALSLHVTTVRFHLEQLEAVQLIRRQTNLGHTQRRGRPQVFYVAAESNEPGTERVDTAREQLITVLASALSAQNHTVAPDGVAGDADLVTASSPSNQAVAAGRTWARNLTAVTHQTHYASQLLEVLTELGFDPAPEGDAIELRACPFRDAARQHPEVICAVHRGMVDELLTTDMKQRGVRLLPFVQPNLCMIADPHSISATTPMS